MRVIRTFPIYSPIKQKTHQSCVNDASLVAETEQISKHFLEDLERLVVLKLNQEIEIM